MYGNGTKSELSAANKPLPQITPLNAKFWEQTKAGVFTIQTCLDCGDKHFPESPVCPNCLSDKQDWLPASGKGTLESWVEFHHAYWDGFKGALPYQCCLVRLEEGPLYVSNLVGDQDNLRLAAAVEVVLQPVTDEVTLPLFQLAK